MIFDTLASAIAAEQVPHKFPAPKYAEQVKHMDSHIFASRRGNTMLQNTGFSKDLAKIPISSQSISGGSKLRSESRRSQVKARIAGVKWLEGLEGLEL